MAPVRRLKGLGGLSFFRILIIIIIIAIISRARKEELEDFVVFFSFPFSHFSFVGILLRFVAGVRPFDNCW